MKPRQMTTWETESRERESNRNQFVIHTGLNCSNGYERAIKDVKERRIRPEYMVER
jgi:hypothetical protein